MTSACKNTGRDIKALAYKFADLECSTISLRKSRFQLADKIRFTQDTLLHLADNVQKARVESQLAVYNKEKDSMLQQSLLLADSIHQQLNYLMKNELTNEHDKASFDQMLNSRLQQQGCIEK